MIKTIIQKTYIVKLPFIHKMRIRKLLICICTSADKEIVNHHTITVPKITIQSPNTKIAGGTIKGDVYVEAEEV